MEIWCFVSQVFAFQLVAFEGVQMCAMFVCVWLVLMTMIGLIIHLADLRACWARVCGGLENMFHVLPLDRVYHNFSFCVICESKFCTCSWRICIDFSYWRAIFQCTVHEFGYS